MKNFTYIGAGKRVIGDRKVVRFDTEHNLQNERRLCRNVDNTAKKRWWRRSGTDRFDTMADKNGRFLY